LRKKTNVKIKCGSQIIAVYDIKTGLNKYLYLSSFDFSSSEYTIIEKNYDTIEYSIKKYMDKIYKKMNEDPSYLFDVNNYPAKIINSDENDPLTFYKTFNIDIDINNCEDIKKVCEHFGRFIKDNLSEKCKEYKLV
jgi:hypothetical protein